jgi:hypothetical protein
VKLPTVDENQGAKKLPEISAALKAAILIGPLQSKSGLKRFIDSRVLHPDELKWATEDDSVLWFLSKRAHAVVNRWLLNSRLSVLAELSPLYTGCILITRERIEHIREHRENQTVGHQAVAELLSQLFVDGAPSFAWNQSSGPRAGGYDHQLVMFVDTYKSKTKEVSGQAPSAIVSFQGTPVPHLKIETAYWVRSSKAKALSP